MTRPQIAFRWEVTAGNLLSASAALLSAVSVVVVAVTAWTNIRRDVDDHARRLVEIEARQSAAAKDLDVLADLPPRILVLETTAARNVERLNAQDVLRAEFVAKFGRLDELMTEVRDQLRTLNRSQP
jgi:hypothetical protein